MGANIVGITSDGGGNLRVCREALESKYTNNYIPPPTKPLFTMECLAYVLTGAWLGGGNIVIGVF